MLFMIHDRKEASGLRLFYWLYGVQVVAGSNPATPRFVPDLFANILRFNCSQSEEIIKFSDDITDFNPGGGEPSVRNPSL